MLSGKSVGEYALFSPIQKDVELKIFDLFFGFAFKGKNSKVRVIARQILPTTLLQDLTPATSLNANSESWSYFSRNLSNIQFLASAWSSNAPIEWQVKIIQETILTMTSACTLSHFISFKLLLCNLH